jgi:hypothetical protein
MAVCRYLQSLLRTTRLNALLAKHMEMSSEIKNLDSDMQMLVYENYNRFISATDTIRTMKSNVDGMDSSMQELEKVTGRLLPCPFKSSLSPPFPQMAQKCVFVELRQGARAHTGWVCCILHACTCKGSCTYVQRSWTFIYSAKDGSQYQYQYHYWYQHQYP